MKNGGEMGSYIGQMARPVSSIGRTGNPIRKPGISMGNNTGQTVLRSRFAGLKAPSNMKNGGSMGKNRPTHKLTNTLRKGAPK